MGQGLPDVGFTIMGPQKTSRERSGAPAEGACPQLMGHWPVARSASTSSVMGGGGRGTQRQSMKQTGGEQGPRRPSRGGGVAADSRHHGG